MGICASKGSEGGNSFSAKQDLPDESSYGIRENMVRRSKNLDVFQFYEIVRTIGAGSMGSVSEVRPKSKAAQQQRKESTLIMRRRGGGAKLGCSSVADNASGKQENQRTYALKHILLDRVTTGFLEELRNEIEILKKLDRKYDAPSYPQTESSLFCRAFCLFTMIVDCVACVSFPRIPSSTWHRWPA